ncbi:MAG: tyrosine-type recombinase/integrase [bacterium]|nr:tyrosine-type recombinase/integrase [bacterium]
MAKKTTKPSARRATFSERGQYPRDKHPVDSYLVGLGDDSERVTRAALDSVADILSGGRLAADELAWHSLRHGHVNALRGRLQQLYAPSTANRYLSALKAVLRESWRLGLVDRETLEKTLDVKGIRGRREARGRAVSQDELSALFATCSHDDNETLGIRDAAILALLYGCGLRRAELAGLSRSDFRPSDRSLKVHGKGNKQRVVYIPAGAQVALEVWLETRGRWAGGLLSGVTKGGRVTRRDVSPQLIYRVIQKRHLKAGIAEFTPHDLRRSHISDLLDEGVDLAVIARQVGHSNVQTTAKYDRRSHRAQRTAADRLDVPYPS